MKLVALALIIAAQFATVAYCQDKPRQIAAAETLKAVQTPETETPTDYDYAWDQFNHRGRLMWACRGLQSGKFVSEEFCAFKDHADTHWPDKKIPGHWKPQ